jgi:hypothetical protein
MIYIQDNFLPEDQFLALKNRVEKRYIAKFGLEEGGEPIRVTHHGKDGDWLQGCYFLGSECKIVTEKIIDTMEGLGIQELNNWSLWFQYIMDKMTVLPHRDGGLRFSERKDTYTALLYTSDWEPEFGGRFIVGEPVHDGPGFVKSLTNLTHTIDPIPNRLLIWSRDEWHAVEEVTVSDPDYKRSFFGTGWSSISSPNVKFDGAI